MRHGNLKANWWFGARFYLDIFFEILADGTSTIGTRTRALNTFPISKQDRLFDPLGLNLQVFDLCPHALIFAALECLYVLPHVPQWADDMVLPGSNTAGRSFDIRAAQHNRPRTSPGTKKKEVDVNSDRFLQSQALLGNGILAIDNK